MTKVNAITAQYWYYAQLELLGRKGQPNRDMSVLSALLKIFMRQNKLAAKMQSR